MSFVVTSSSVAISYINNHSVPNLRFCESSSNKPCFSFVHCKYPLKIQTLKREQSGISKSTVVNCTNHNFESFTEEDMVFPDLGDQEIEDGDYKESPWEGAVIFRRNPSITHVEYCTTLERLGLGNLSSEVSKSRASVMGLRVTKAVKDYPDGTPVQISIDITRRKNKLRLDGIVKTVITLSCNRCGDPAAECIFSNLTLLLTNEPVEEPDIINMGIIYGDKVKSYYTGVGSQGEEDDDDSIDFEDRLYFRPEDKEIDISKHIRDLVHLEITIAATCNPNCKGLCLNCGKNLNTSSCVCNQKVNKAAYGPLANLKRQMQQK